MPDPLLLTTILETTTEDTLAYLKRQQLVIQKQLLDQELLNRALYERLLNTGFLTTSSTTPASIFSTSTSFLDSIKNKFNLNNALTTTAINSATSKAVNPLAAMLPYGDMLNGINSIISSLFGSEYWMYWALALAIGVATTFLSCCCMYFMCCSSLGRSLMCCCKCSGISGKKKKSSSSGTKKCCV